LYQVIVSVKSSGTTGILASEVVGCIVMSHGEA
jgi:hypothetical protein